MRKRKGKQWILTIGILLLGAWLGQKTSMAGTYDNAITFWNQFGNTGTQNDEYLYFCTKGSTAQGGTKYKTIGYSVLVKVGGTNLTPAQFKLQNAYDIDSRASGGNTYTLRRIPVTKVQNRLQLANDEKVLYRLYTETQTYTFDSIMTVAVNGTDGGSVAERDTGKVSTTGEVYTTLSGIKGARAWANPSDLNNYYGKNISVKPVNPLSVSGIILSGGNAYNAGVRSGGATYYVKPGTAANLSFTTYSAFTSVNFKPNANLFHVTGYGNDECVDVRTQMDNNDALYWKDAGPLGISSATSNRNGGDLSSTITGAVDLPDGQTINVYPQGKIFLKRSITAANNRRSDDYVACDTPQYDDKKRVAVIGDGAAPNISVNGEVVSASDGGSGVRSITIVNEDGSVYATYSGTVCSVPSGTFTAYAEDNVGNRSMVAPVVNRAKVKLSASGNEGWNPKNVRIDGSTDRGKIQGITVWSFSAGQNENSMDAVFFPLDGTNVSITFNPSRFYGGIDGGYLLGAKTVVYDAMGGRLGEDKIEFWVSMDEQPPAMGWGRANESEMKWGKPGETYPLAFVAYDYNRNPEYGGDIASGVQSLVISDVNSGEALSHGSYNEGKDRYVAEPLLTSDKSLMVRAVDKAGNAIASYTDVRFDAEPPTVEHTAIVDKGVQNKRTGWRNGDVIITSKQMEAQTGVYQSGWETYDRTDGSLYGEWKDVAPTHDAPNWRRAYPNLIPQDGVNRSVDFVLALEGSYTFVSYAEDHCENRGEAKMEVKIDKKPPQITYSGVDEWNCADTTVAVTDVKEEWVNEVSNLQNTTCYYNFGGEKIKVADMGNEEIFDLLSRLKDYNGEEPEFDITGDGIHSLTLESRDNAENQSAKPISLYLDHSPPEFEVVTEGKQGDEDGNPKQLSIRMRDETSGIRYYSIEEKGAGQSVVRARKGVEGMEGDSYAVGTASMGKTIDLDVELDDYQGGVFAIRIIDEAGNGYYGEYEPTWVGEFTVSASLHRSLSTEGDVVFKTGEQGYIDVRTLGYVDEVEIQFPASLTQYDDEWEESTYSLAPQARDGLRHYFYVPLYAPEGEYPIQVVGHKGEESKRVPLTLTVKDSVLDGIRTRIRG